MKGERERVAMIYLIPSSNSKWIETDVSMGEKLWEWNLIKFIIRIMQIEENSICFFHIYIFHAWYEFNFLVLL